jgi:PAS domain-containing protein
MKKETLNSPEITALRQKAEEQFRKKHSEKSSPTATGTTHSESDRNIADAQKLLHELEVYEIELLMQNEELKLAREKAETATEKYTAIYDFAYTGFFTLNAEAKICELNLSAAKMLGKERSVISNSNFRKIVTMDTIPTFDDFFSKVFESDSKQSCEVRLIVKGSPSIFVHIEGIVAVDEEKCLLTVVDITKRMQAEGILKLKAHEFELFNELMETSDQQLIELKKEINHLLKKLGEKEKFKIDEILKERR